MLKKTEALDCEKADFSGIYEKTGTYNEIVICKKRENNVKSLFKKNQLMITALAIMIAIAGYLQFAGTNLEEEYLITNDQAVSGVNSGGVITENLTSETLSETGLTAGEFTLDGLLDLSEEDLAGAALTDIESLDSDVNVIMEDYLEQDMETAQTGNQSAQAQPKEGEVPGEAVFTASSGVTVLSEAKLLKEQTRAKNKETLLDIINSTGLTDEQKQEAVNNMVEMTKIAEMEAAAEILLEAKGFQDVVVSINGDCADVVVNEASLDDIKRAQIEDIVKRKTQVEPQNIIISTVAQ